MRFVGRNRRLAYLVAAIGLTLGLVVVTAAFAVTKSKTFSSGSISRFLPDNALTVSKINVKKQGKIKDVDVRVRADHTAPNDLVFTLRSPAGKYVKLEDFDDAMGPNVGTGPNTCAGTFFVFNDEAPTPFPGPVSPTPAVGKFQPQFPLSKFDGEHMKGKWELQVDDVNTDETGTLGCWQLAIKYKPL